MRRNSTVVLVLLAVAACGRSEIQPASETTGGSTEGGSTGGTGPSAGTTRGTGGGASSGRTSSGGTGGRSTAASSGSTGCAPTGGHCRAGSTGVTSGSSGGPVGTGSGSTGGGTGGFCIPEFTPCDPTGNGLTCNCGTACVFDVLRQGTVCEAPCTQTADCTTPYTVCNGATCTIDLCGLALGGPPNGTLDGTCDASGQNDGTCVPTMAVGDGGAFGVCYQGGPASGQGCSLTATRATPGGLCQAGSICGVSTMGFGTQCYLLCNPTDPNAAAACNVAGFNNGCFQPTARDSQLGVCF